MSLAPGSRIGAYEIQSPLGVGDIYRKAADGSAGEVRLVDGLGNKYVNSSSPDGRFVPFHTGTTGSQTGTDLWVLPLSDNSKPRPLLQTAFNESDGEFSPDG